MKFQSVTREDWTGQKLDVTTWEDEISFMTWTLKALNGLTFVLILILLAIVVIGIMNTMWIAIRERTREIGTLRAIGMQRGAVLWMFLLESLMLGLFGDDGRRAGGRRDRRRRSTALHIPVPLRGAVVPDVATTSTCPCTDRCWSEASSLITVVTGLAALYPSLRAARLQPGRRHVPFRMNPAMSMTT